jgi:hypothetical protein
MNNTFWDQCWASVLKCFNTPGSETFGFDYGLARLQELHTFKIQLRFKALFKTLVFHVYHRYPFFVVNCAQPPTYKPCHSRATLAWAQLVAPPASALPLLPANVISRKTT